MRRTGLAVAFVVLVALVLVFLLSRPTEVHAEPDEPGPASQPIASLSPPIAAVPARTHEDAEPRAPETRSRRGRVIDVEGKPIVGAQISLMFGRSEPIRSDERGEFNAVDVDPVGGVVVSHPCCLEAHARPPEDDAAPFVITLEPRPVVHLVPFAGLVVDEDEHPVPGATVEGSVLSAFKEPAQGFAGKRHPRIKEAFRADSDAQGRFSVDVPEDAEVLLGASLGRNKSARAQFPASASPRLKILARDCSLSGRVVSRDGSPVGRFEIRFTSVEFERAVIFDSPDGSWRFSGLPAVAATVGVVASGFLDAQRELTLSRGEERDGVDFALERGLSLTGTVFDATTRQPLPGATIGATGHHGKLNGQATSDQQGAFQLVGLRAGRVELVAWCSGYRDHEVTVEANQQGPVRIELTPAADSDSSRGNDYEGVGMQFESGSPDAGQGYRVIALHPEGGARVAGVEIGDHILAAEGVRAGSVPLEEFLRQIKGAEGTVVTLEVRRGEKVFELHAVRRRLVWER